MFVVELTDSWSNIINIFIGDSTKINLRRLTYLYNHGQSPLDLIERCVSFSLKNTIILASNIYTMSF